jgi:23S rRNA (uracil1939-C5)-methyltransferase
MRRFYSTRSAAAARPARGARRRAGKIGLRRARRDAPINEPRSSMSAPPQATAPVATTPAVVRIVSLDQEGRGIARIDGKAIFVEGALPGEDAAIVTLKRKPTYEIARAEAILRTSGSRVTPRCPHFGVCGGCTLQHFDAAAQVATKQRALEDALWHIGRARPAVMLPAIHGPAWGYRHRARLSVRYVAKKGGVLVGFHEKKSSYVADMTSCAILPPKISRLLPALRALVGELALRDRLPQIELAVGDVERPDAWSASAGTPRGPAASQPTYALVLRILETLNADDAARLRSFADAHGIQFYVQTAGPETAVPFHPPEPRLAYELPEFGLRFPYAPTEFTQVNPSINRVLVRRALALLAPGPGERVVDFFCGLGNFTLPIARRGALAVGIEGSAALVRRATANAAANGLTKRASFRTANLFEATAESIEALGSFDKALIDPPREGAIAVVKALPPDGGPRRIVYVSCNPATLARDAGVLVQERGYALAAAGIVNMFPHTAHVESIAVFER